VTSASADSLFAADSESSAGTDGPFTALVRSAAEIHVAPAGDQGRHVARLCSAIPNIHGRRRVLHKYAADSMGVCARGGAQGAEGCEAVANEDDWLGWQVLELPRGFAHLAAAIDEPLAEDLLPACDAANPLHRLLFSFQASQALPPDAKLVLSIDDAPLLSGPITPKPPSPPPPGSARADQVEATSDGLEPCLA